MSTGKLGEGKWSLTFPTNVTVRVLPQPGIHSWLQEKMVSYSSFFPHSQKQLHCTPWGCQHCLGRATPSKGLSPNNEGFSSELLGSNNPTSSLRFPALDGSFFMPLLPLCYRHITPLPFQSSSIYLIKSPLSDLCRSN